tara:strand:+ start:453 stop:647 length:195 start_codon:yes stop_codon:yes gene_type:complete
MPKYERYPGEPKAKAESRIKRNIAKKKKKKKAPAKKEVAAYKKGRERRKPKRPGRRKGMFDHYV